MQNAAHSQSADALQQVATVLDMAQADFDQSQDQRDYSKLREAAQAYYEAVNTAWLARLRKLEDMGCEPGDEKLARQLGTAWEAARKHLDALPDTATARERIDAQMDEVRAEALYEIVNGRYQILLEKQKLERRKVAEAKKRK
jgi:hypothetical protein